MLILIIGAIVVVFVALAVVKTFFWLTLIALVVLFLAVAFGISRLGHRSARRSRWHY